MKEPAVQMKTPESAPMSAASAPKAVFSNRPAAHPTLRLQRAIGNQAVQRLIQAEFAVGQPRDPEMVRRGTPPPDWSHCAQTDTGGLPIIQRDGPQSAPSSPQLESPAELGGAAPSGGESPRYQF